MKTFTKALIVLAVAGGGYAYYASQQQKKSLPDAPNPKPGPIAPDDNAPLVEGFIGGAEDGLAQPLIFLIHDEGSTPEEAFKFLPNVAARVIAPTGRYEKDGKRYFVNPEFTGVSYAIALRKELTRLQAVLEDAISKSSPLPEPYRAKVVGLGRNGALAVGLGLYLPTRVGGAWGTGGAVPTSWVPTEPQKLMNAERPTLYKISVGADQVGDEATWKLCYERNYDLRLQKVDKPPTAVEARDFVESMAEFIKTA